MTKKSTYKELKPSSELQEFVHSFWMHKNNSDKYVPATISPDSFFKIIFIVSNSEIINYFMTGLWTEQKDFSFPPNATVYGCRLKLLAPEFLLGNEIASIRNKLKQLNLSYLNIENFNLSEFETAVKQWEVELLKTKPEKAIPGNKIRLSQLLYKVNGGISVSEVSEQIYWASRQINRYLNKYLGVSLKTYLSIQRCYDSYIHIREGRLYPEKNYYDQAHFIREVKKHTGKTPRVLNELQNDQFIQLKNIQKK
ncbi:AraC family transcriptional regulator [Aureibaculum conchae]|uniref:AraC family transcriptional regulator n=1 Tax=Aureibaculum sp. 2308TA14-22 TaxID=3108392 RepID=UPI003398191C